MENVIYIFAYNLANVGMKPEHEGWNIFVYLYNKKVLKYGEQDVIFVNLVWVILEVPLMGKACSINYVNATFILVSLVINDFHRHHWTKQQQYNDNRKENIEEEEGRRGFHLVNTRTSNFRALSKLEHQFPSIVQARSANSWIFQSMSELKHQNFWVNMSGHQADRFFCAHYPDKKNYFIKME